MTRRFRSRRGNGPWNCVGCTTLFSSSPTTLEVAKRARFLDTVRALLNANRSLCLDFVNVSEIETERYSLCAEIEIDPGVDPTATAARVLFEVDRYLAPTVLNYDLETMRAKSHEDGTPYTLAEIFAGPRLKNGFIDDQELADADPRTEIRLSDVISIIMDLPGVLAVRDIVVNALRTDTPDGKPEPVTPADKWRLEVAPGKQPRLHESAWRLVFYKRNLPTPAQRDQVSAAWLEMKKQAQQRVETAHDEDVAIPQGRFRSVSRYHSFQNHFPAVFGLSDAGLPSTADDRQRAGAATQGVLALLRSGDGELLRPVGERPRTLLARPFKPAPTSRRW